MKDSLVSTRKVVPSAAACCSAHGAVQPDAGASKAEATLTAGRKTDLRESAEMGTISS